MGSGSLTLKAVRVLTWLKTFPAASPFPGAFLGMPAMGVRQVGRILAGIEPGEPQASAILYPACVTQTMFKYVFGRPMQISDVRSSIA